MTAPHRMQYDEIAAALALLAKAFPECFSLYAARRRPLKVGIHKDILERLGEAMTPHKLGSALACYVANGSYRRKLLAGASRIDLDGNPCGTVTAAQEADARAKIAAANGRAAQLAKNTSNKRQCSPHSRNGVA
jgi:ProP effector